MGAIVKDLNLNQNPQYVKNNSLVFAKNIKLDDLGNNIVMDDNIVDNKVISACKDKGFEHIKIAGCISTPNELIVFFKDNKVSEDPENPKDNTLKIARYNEDLDSVQFINTNIIYNEGEINGTYNYTVRQELIIIFCESNSSTGVNNCLKTINCGTFGKEDIEFNQEESYFNVCPDVPICRCKLLNLVSGINIPNGVYQFFIRYKIDSTNFSKWFPIGKPYYGIHKEHRDLINYGNTVKSKFNVVVNNVNLDSSYGFELNLNFENKPSYIKKFQLGYILNHNDSMVGRIYNTFDINEESQNNIIFDGKYIFEHEVANFIEQPLNLFNVGNIVNYNHRVYVSNYNENNDNLYNDEIKTFVDNIEVFHKLEDVPETKKSSGFYYSITLNYKRSSIGTVSNTFEHNCTEELNFTNDVILDINEYILEALGFVGSTRITNYYDNQHNDKSDLAKNCKLKLTKEGKVYFIINEHDINYAILNREDGQGLGTIRLNSFSYEFKDYQEIETDNFSVQTLIPGEVYNFFVHFVRKDGTYTNGYQLTNKNNAQYGDGGIDLRWTIEEFCINKPDEYQLYIKNDIRKKYGNKYLYEVLTNPFDDYFGYYANSKGDILFRAPRVYNKIIKPEFYTSKELPSNFIGLFFSYEKVEPLVLYQGITRKLIRSLDAELNLSSYKPDFVYFADNNRVSGLDAINVKNSKLWASNIYPKTIGNNGGVEIDLDLESGITLEDMYNKQCIASIFNRNIYTKSSKTLIRLTDVIGSETLIRYIDGNEENRLPISENICDFNYPGFYCKEYYIEYTKNLTFVEAGDYQKPSGLREVNSNSISTESINENFTETCGSYYKYSRFDLSCISIKQKPSTKVMLVSGSNLEYNLYIDPANLSDTFELKSDFILNKSNSTGILDIISNSEYDDQRPTIERFDNTVRRSDVFANESIENTWRNFTASNYKVISNIRGKIVKLVPSGKIFIVHLEHSMFAFDRDNKMKLQDKEIQLSTPDTFDLEAQELFTSENGFAGLQYKEASIINGYGYTFYDNYTKYIYNYTDGKFSILSFPIQKFINEHNINNVCILSDDANSRIIFCFYIGYETACISYNFLTKTFISLHDFEFNKSWNTRDKCYFRTRLNNYLVQFDNSENVLNKYGNAISISGKQGVEFGERYDNIFLSLYDATGDFITPYSIVDIIFNEVYDTTKCLNSITYILNKKGFRNTRGFACDNDSVKYPGEKILIYTEICETDYQNLQPRANDSSLETDNKVTLNSYQRPWFEKGKWNYNYFRNILDDNDSRTFGTSDSKSLIYGKYIVVRLVIKSTIKFKLENINFNVNRYSNETIN